MKFEELVGKKVGFCGVDNNTFCVVTPSGERLAFEVVEDPDDGYRSAMQEVKSVPLDGKIFFQCPIVLVEVKEENDDCSLTGYRLIDDDGHEWLHFGTYDLGDYYPGFAFAYDPRKEAA